MSAGICTLSICELQVVELLSYIMNSSGLNSCFFLQAAVAIHLNSSTKIGDIITAITYTGTSCTVV